MKINPIGFEIYNKNIVLILLAEVRIGKQKPKSKSKQSLALYT